MAGKLSLKLALIGALLWAGPTLAQDESTKPPKVSDKLPPANPLPYMPPDVAAVMAPVNAVLAGLAAHDPAAIEAQLASGGSVTTLTQTARGPDKLERLGWTAFLERIKPNDDRYEERLSDPAIESDGHVALVWAPYVFYQNGKAQHCGTNHFDLVKQADGWKIANITYSQRTSNCGQ